MTAPATAYVRIRRDRAAYAVEGQVECALGAARVAGADDRDDDAFLRWSWDGRCLTVRNDRLGLFPAFYAVYDDGIAVASSLVELVRGGAPTDLDVEALLLFREIGFFLGDDTPFTHIRALPTSARLEWDGELRLEHELQLGGSLTISREEAMTEFAELMREAVLRRVPDEPFAVPLSGGRDSRHILFELVAAGAPPALTVTAAHMWPNMSTDLDVAPALAAAVSVPHVVVAQLPRYEAEKRKNVITHFCADEGAWMLAVADYLAGRVAMLYDGLAGAELSASYYQSPELLRLYAEGRLDLIAGKLLRDNGRAKPGFPVGTTRTRDEIVHLCRERIVREMERFSAATNPLTTFMLHNRTRREIGLVPFAIYPSTGLEAFCPFLDRDVYDFLVSLPPEVQDRQFHTDTIAATHPRFADIAYSKGQTRAPEPSVRRALTRQIVRDGVRRRPARLPAGLRYLGDDALRWLHEDYREQNDPVDPIFLLYLWQLEDLVEHGRYPPRP